MLSRSLCSFLPGFSTPRGEIFTPIYRKPWVSPSYLIGPPAIVNRCSFVILYFLSAPLIKIYISTLFFGFNSNPHFAASLSAAVSSLCMLSVVDAQSTMSIGIRRCVLVSWNFHSREQGSHFLQALEILHTEHNTLLTNYNYTRNYSKF